MSIVYIEDVGDFKIDRATKLLAGIRGGVYRAVGSALKRAAQHGKTIGIRLAAEQYTASQGEFRSRTTDINPTGGGGGGSYSVTFGYRGSVLPLMSFDTGVGKNGGVSARVLRSSGRKSVDHAFRASMGGNNGIYIRVGSTRFPVKGLYGPSAVQAFTAHEENIEKMEKAVKEKYDERIEHEILRVLNGWG